MEGFLRFTVKRKNKQVYVVIEGTTSIVLEMRERKNVVYMYCICLLLQKER